MQPMRSLAAIAFLLLCSVVSEASYCQYEIGDLIPAYANIIGPFHNSRETYRFYDLPFCSSGSVSEKKETLGELLNGDRLVHAPYKFRFRDSHNSKLLCKKKLMKEDVARFKSVIAKDYYFQMYFDDLPIWSFLGSYRKNNFGDNKYFLYRHHHFHILYNNHCVIEVNVQVDQTMMVNITEDKETEVEFMYSVTWSETGTPFEKRLEKYLPSSQMRHYEIQWFSTMNSCILVLLVTGFLAMTLIRVLKNDLIKYNIDVESGDDQEETGWKYIHADVFRFPKSKSLFAACVGSGTQLLALAVTFFILSLLGTFYPYNRGASLTAFLVLYVLSSSIAGFISTSFYCQMEGTNWVNNIMLTGWLFSGPFFLVFFILNTVAMTYGVTAEVPVSTILIIAVIWTLVSFPLLVLGGIAGKRRNKDFQAPCRTSKCPREIPLLPWYRRTIPQIAIAGFLPFSAICVELYYVFATLWGHRLYAMYGILLTVFIILVIVTAFITVALTFFQLAAEDHRWWWRSFLCGGSTALYMYAFCFHYYFNRTNMSGFLQTSFFFGYMACICYGFFLMLGTVGFCASLFFVRHIYGSIKCE